MKRLILAALVLLLTAPAASFEGDQAARLGDYEKAEAQYRAAQASSRDPAEQRRLLARRLAVAQARNDVPAVRALSAELEQALEGVNDPEVALRLYLVRGAVAARTKDVQGAREAFEKARPLAERLTAQRDPGGALGLAECNSSAYLGGLAGGGRPAPEAYVAACTAAYQPSTDNPPTAEKPLWPLDVYRTTYWTRLWIWQAWEYSYYAYRGGDQTRANAWSGVAYGIGEYALRSLLAGFQATGNVELATAATQVALELTEAFPLASWTPAVLSQVEGLFTAFPDTPELRFIRGRFHRSRARQAFSALNDPARALEHYQEAARWFGEAGALIDQMDIWVEKAYVFTLEQPTPEAWAPVVEADLTRLLSQTERIHYPNGRYFGLGFMGVLKARQRDLAAAEPLLRQALAQLLEWSRDSGETARARAQTLQKPEVRLFSDTLVEVLLEQDRPVEAVEATGRLAALAESAGLDLTRVTPRNPATAQTLRSLEQERRQRGRLQAELQSAQLHGDAAAVKRLEGALDQSRAEFQKTINTLRQADPDFERLLSVRPSSFAKLQASLPPDVVLVAYYPAADKTVLFAATQSELKIFTAPLGRERLTGLVRSVRQQVHRQAPLDQAVLGELYGGLVEPLEPMLEGDKLLAVIPSGALYYLPFAALQKPAGPPLVEKVRLCLLTATEMPAVSGFGRSDRPSTLLALADPDGSLPGAGTEVQELSTLFAAPKVFVGDAASEERVAGGVDVLHLATHGVLNSADVNESYLLVAGGDGRLTTGEIYGLDLKDVSLVTLSACQTALGEANPGSEIATLAQAFSIAGSQSMLGSLWKVDDAATARLMVEFYTRLLAGDSKAEALRGAQLAVKSDPRWSHPFYWSSFALIGDWH